MATINNFKNVKKEEYVQPLVTLDIDIIEYFYAAIIYEILDDDNLVRLIDSNGFYKTAFCEAYELDEISINIDGNETVWYGAPKGVPGAYDSFVNGAMGIVGSKIENAEIVEINKVYGE
jgi:hypothetical protein